MELSEPSLRLDSATVSSGLRPFPLPCRGSGYEASGMSVGIWRGGPLAGRREIVSKALGGPLWSLLWAIRGSLLGLWGAFFGLLGLSWGPLGSSWGPQRVGKFDSRFEIPVLRLAWGCLGTLLGRLGRLWGGLGAFLGRLGGLLGASWALLGRSRVPLRRS